jgi:hypothetical protein
MSEVKRGHGRHVSVRRVAYVAGRVAQLVGMWLLLVDLFTAGPLGPNPRLFAAGVVIFFAGWSIIRLTA